MAVYMLLESKITDQEKYGEYMAAVADIIAAHGGRFLVRGGRITPLFTGSKMERRQPEKINIVEFPSEAHQRRFLTSPEYRAILPLRQASAETRALLLEGYAPDKQ